MAKGLIICPQQYFLSVQNVALYYRSDWLTTTGVCWYPLTVKMKNRYKATHTDLRKHKIEQNTRDWYSKEEGLHMWRALNNVSVHWGETFLWHFSHSAQLHGILLWMIHVVKRFKNTDAKSVKKLEEEICKDWYLLNVWCSRERLTSHLAIVTSLQIPGHRWLYVLPALLTSHTVSLLRGDSDRPVRLGSLCQQFKTEYLQLARFD